MEVQTQSFSSFDLNSDRPPFSSCFGDESSLLRSPKSPENDVFQPPVECDGSDSSVSAAMKVQKFYRGYRTRRLLADSAVVAEELWWRAIDFARLNHTTVSFFNFMKPETASSRWNRISSNASKVGKGLSKDAKAQKLAFQHWIEAIDPRHRYGHSLHLYYEVWCKADSGQPFFYWLDIGDGKEVDLPNCPRSKLRQQCIKYLGPQEREHYEYVVVEGTIVHQQTGEFLDTNNPLPGAKWIFVMSTSKRLYAGEKKKGVFHHSSFLAGGTTLAAGRLVVENGTLKLSKSKERINKTRLDFMMPDAHGMCTRLMLEAYPKDYIDTIIGESISAYSGHYRPTDEILDSFLSFLKDNGVNLDQIEIHKANEDYEDYGYNKSNIDGSVDSHRSDILNVEDNESLLEKTEVSQTEAKHNYRRTLSGGLKSPKAEVPKTAILQRINSKKAAKSYQLGNQLTLKWSTGVGPRIGCIADYPAELRLQALEFTNLSPRTPPTPSAYIRVGDFVLPLARPSPRTTTADLAVLEN